MLNTIHSQGVKTFFKSPEGKFFVSADLHIHTVFSDGSVWPTIRVEEALRDSIDLISLTEHLEYQHGGLIFQTQTEIDLFKLQLDMLKNNHLQLFMELK